jgi:hypothetical protein
MAMNMQEISIHLNILNTMNDCQRICSDYILTAACCGWFEYTTSYLHSIL